MKEKNEKFHTMKDHKENMIWGRDPNLSDYLNPLLQKDLKQQSKCQCTNTAKLTQGVFHVKMDRAFVSSTWT